MNHADPNVTTPPEAPAWWDALPADLNARLESTHVVRAGFAAGPGFIAGKSVVFAPPTDRDGARAWLKPFEGSLRRCSIEFADGTLVFFESGGRFLSERSATSGTGPRAGVTVVHEEPDAK